MKVPVPYRGKLGVLRKKDIMKMNQFKVSVPSRGELGVLPNATTKTVKIDLKKFPSPLEVNRLFYPIFCA